VDHLTRKFYHKSANQKIIFGVDSVDDLPRELKVLGLKRPFIISSLGRNLLTSNIIGILGDKFDCTYQNAISYIHEEEFDLCNYAIGNSKSDCIISVGGGAIIGLCKSLAVNLGVPLITIVLTYSGSEISNNWAIGCDDLGRSGESILALPSLIIYDPKLTLSLPINFSLASGMNALSHAVESLYGDKTTNKTNIASERAIRILNSSLPALIANPMNIKVRTEILYGAWLAASFRGGSGISHQIARMIGHSFSLNHAEVHAKVLPYAVWFNENFATKAIKIIKRSINSHEAGGGLYDFVKLLGLKTGINEPHISKNDVSSIMENILKNDFHNPRPLNSKNVLLLLNLIFDGDRPKSP
jgi:maleylacetate reductase